MICRNCHKPIEKIVGGHFYPFTHVDPDQNDCFVAEPEGRKLSTSTDELERLRELVRGLKEACETCLSGDPSDSLSPQYWLNRIGTLGELP